MGMFDTISWASSLPLSEEMKDLGLHKNNWSFQTKDLDCAMDNYVYQDNQLFLVKYKTHECVEGDKTSKNWIDKIGYIKREGEYLETQNFTGTILMYDYQQNVIGLWDCSTEFKVVFIDGKVKTITLNEFLKLSNRERIQRENKYKLVRQIENSKWYNIVLFHTKPYRWIKRKLFNIINSVGTFIVALSYKIL